MGNPLRFPDKNPAIRSSGDLLPCSQGGGACTPFPGRKNPAPKASQRGCPSCWHGMGEQGRDSASASAVPDRPEVLPNAPGAVLAFSSGWCCCVLVLMEIWSFEFLAFCFKTAFFSSVVTVGRKSTNWEHKSAFLKKLRQKVSYSFIKAQHFISSPSWRELSLYLILPLFSVLCGSLLALSVITVLWSHKSLASLASS